RNAIAPPKLPPHGCGKLATRRIFKDHLPFSRFSLEFRELMSVERGNLGQTHPSRDNFMPPSLPTARLSYNARRGFRREHGELGTNANGHGNPRSLVKLVLQP